MKKIIQHLKEDWYKYLLEILVIALSIFAGLELENWNENRKEKKLTVIYLEGLLFDLKSDTTYYSARIAESYRVIDGNKKFVVEIFQDQTFEEQRELFSQREWANENITIQNTTYTQLESSGGLSLFNNPNFTRKLVEYHKQSEIAYEHFQEYNDAAGIATDLFNNTITGRRFLLDSIYRYDDWRYINDPHHDWFKITLNEAIFHIEKHEVFIGYYEDLRNRAVELLNLIQKDLGS